MIFLSLQATLCAIFPWRSPLTTPPQTLFFPTTTVSKHVLPISHSNCLPGQRQLALSDFYLARFIYWPVSPPDFMTISSQLEFGSHLGNARKQKQLAIDGEELCDLIVRNLEHFRFDPQSDRDVYGHSWQGGDDGLGLIEALGQNIWQSFAVEAAAGETEGRLGPGRYISVIVLRQIGAVSEIGNQHVLVEGVDVVDEFLRLDGIGGQLVVGLVAGVAVQNAHLDLESIFHLLIGLLIRLFQYSPLRCRPYQYSRRMCQKNRTLTSKCAQVADPCP